MMATNVAMTMACLLTPATWMLMPTQMVVLWMAEMDSLLRGLRLRLPLPRTPPLPLPLPRTPPLPLPLPLTPPLPLPLTPPMPLPLSSPLPLPLTPPLPLPLRESASAGSVPHSISKVGRSGRAFRPLPPSSILSASTVSKKRKASASTKLHPADRNRVNKAARRRLLQQAEDDVVARSQAPRSDSAMYERVPLLPPCLCRPV